MSQLDVNKQVMQDFLIVYLYADDLYKLQLKDGQKI